MLHFDPDIVDQLPEDNIWCCYVLLSCQDKKTTYIGQTSNLCRRLREHNSSFGLEPDSPEDLRPWAVAAYVTGFDADGRASTLAFESEWKHAWRERRVNSRDELSVLDVIACGTDIIFNNDRFADGLRMRIVILHVGRSS